jgi:predicted alpha/beta hydrolase family esterase
MKTIIFVHGGESFTTETEYYNWITTTWIEWNLEPFVHNEEKKKWKTEIAKKATACWNLVYLPNFPNPQNAKYREWKLFFDAWIQKIQIEWELILIGSSLGGCFLLKYLSESPTLSKAWEIHLVAACISAWDFSEPENYSILQSLRDRVHIWHAEDDSIVPFSVGQEIAQILPNAQTHFFGSEKWYGHFNKVENLVELEKLLLL